MNDQTNQQIQNKLISYTAFKITPCDTEELRFIRENEQIKLNRNIKKVVGK